MRSFSSFVSGIADVPLPRFVLGTFIGSILYCLPWLVLGDLFGANYRAPLRYLDHFGLWGIAVVIGVVLVLFVLHRLTGHLALRGLAQHFHYHHKEHHHTLKLAPLLEH